MLNRFAKFLLVSTSLSPLLGAIVVSQYAHNEPWSSWVGWLVAALLLIFLCWALLRYAAQNVEEFTFHVTEFESNDKEALSFLLAYLLPFIAPENMAFSHEWMTGTYILVIIVLVITHAGAYHFNPMMGLLGYHFYAVKDMEGISCLLISKKELRRKDTKVQTVRLAHNIYLDRKDGDA